MVRFVICTITSDSYNTFQRNATFRQFKSHKHLLYYLKILKHYMIKSSLMSELQTWVQPQIKENLGHDWYNVMLDMLSECKLHVLSSFLWKNYYFSKLFSIYALPSQGTKCVSSSSFLSHFQFFGSNVTKKPPPVPIFPFRLVAPASISFLYVFLLIFQTFIRTYFHKGFQLC
jgi:hypothetical protein